MIPLYTEQEFKKAKNKDVLPLKCKICDKIFLLTKHGINLALNPKNHHKANYCSSNCQYKGLSKKETIICSNCNKRFDKRLSEIKKSFNHFCSSSCSAKYNNTHKTYGTRRSKLETWLEYKLQEKYPNLEFHFNRKDAINSELDIYIPSLKLAFELNGIFHYEPIYGEEKLSNIINNDQRKFQACLDKQIELCIIDTSMFKNFKEHKAEKFLDIIVNLICFKKAHTQN